jgi:hypothetical protein
MILRSQGPIGLYSGLSPVVAFMGPKLALRFTSFESFKKLMIDDKGKLSALSALQCEFYTRQVESTLFFSMNADHICSRWTRCRCRRSRGYRDANGSRQDQDAIKAGGRGSAEVSELPTDYRSGGSGERIQRSLQRPRVDSSAAIYEPSW